MCLLSQLSQSLKAKVPHMLKKFWNDETGVIISAELVLVLTIAVLTMIVGLAEVATAVNTELNDVANAIGSFNQTFTVTGFGSASGHPKVKAYTFGFGWLDTIDDCDTDTTCDIVQGAPAPATQTGAVGTAGG